jgi:hypothetical protein
VTEAELEELRGRLSARQLVELERPLKEAADRLASFVRERDYGSAGGPPPGVDPDRLTIDDVIAKVIELHERNRGVWPTQADVADGLGKSDRWIRVLLRREHLPWRMVLALAEEERTSG